MVQVSVVIPARDEREALAVLIPETARALDSAGLSGEIVVVDDGSQDGTWELLEHLSHSIPILSAIQLRQSFGQTAALQAGFDHSRGDIVVTMDGDGQNDPADIPKLLAAIHQGAEVVCGWRTHRQDSGVSKRLPSTVANRLIRYWSGSKLHDQGCGIKAFRREILEDLRIHGEQHRFIGALAEALGARVTEIPVNHRPRETGKSHYGWGRLPKVFLDLLFLKYIQNYANRPLHFFGGGGLVSCFIGFTACGWVTFEKFIFKIPAADRPLLLLGILLILIGVVLITLGILAELVVRGQHETTGRPIYRIRGRLGPG